MPTYWAPKNVPPHLQTALAVELPSVRAMNASLHRQLMEDKVERLVRDAGAQAKAALQMSTEHAPELQAISQEIEPAHWPIAIMRSDLMQDALGAIDWSQQKGLPLPASQIAEALQEQSLQSLLEAL